MEHLARAEQQGGQEGDVRRRGIFVQYPADECQASSGRYLDQLIP